MRVYALDLLPDLLAICRMDANATVPPWAHGPFVSIVRSRDELSVVCPQVHVPAQVPSERDWRCLRTAGPLDLSLTGVIASLTHVLAAKEVSVFVVSTFDTDYLLVKQAELKNAKEALVSAGHTVRDAFD